MKITVYTVSNCQFCKQEKDYLLSHNLSYEEKNLESNRDFLTEMLAVSNNFAGTPVTKIEKDDGQITVLKGFTKEEFDQALGSATAAETTTVQTPAFLQPTPSIEIPPASPVPAPQVQAHVEEIVKNEPQEPIPPAPIFSPTPVETPKPEEKPVIQLTEKPEEIIPTIIPPASTPTQAPPVNNQPVAASPNDTALNSLISDLEAKSNTQEAPSNPSSIPPTVPPTSASLPNIPDFNAG